MGYYCSPLLYYYGLLWTAHDPSDLFVEHLSKAEVTGSALFGASLLKFVLFEMHFFYLINFRPVLFGSPLQLGALSARLVRLWVNPVLNERTKQ